MPGARFPGLKVKQFHYLKLLFAPILWGGALIAGRIISPLLPPFTITFLRFVLVSLFFIPVLYLKNGSFPRPSKKGLLLLLSMSISGIVLFNFFLFSGLRTVTAIRSSVIIAFTPAVVAVVSGLFFHEKINTLMKIGLLAAFTGAIITITEGNLKIVFTGGLSRGDLYLIGCVLTWTAYSISAKYTMRELSPFTVLTYGSIIGAVLLIPFTLREGVIFQLSGQPAACWWSLIYLSFGAAGIAYLFYYEGIKNVGASRAAVFLNLEPVSAIVLGIIVLGEHLSLPVAVGGILVLGGLFLTKHPGKRGSKLRNFSAQKPVPQPRLCECTEEDIPLLAEIGRKTYHETFASMNNEETLQTYLDAAFNQETLLNELRSDYSRFFLLFRGEEPAGYLKLNEYEAQTDLCEAEGLEIERIYLLSAFQGLGLGRILMHKAIETAGGKGKKYVWLGVWKKNSKAVGFYRRMGFEVFGSHDFKMGDELQSDHLMKLDLLKYPHQAIGFNPGLKHPRPRKHRHI